MDLGEPDLRSADRAAKNNTFMLSRLWRPEFQTPGVRGGSVLPFPGSGDPAPPWAVAEPLQPPLPWLPPLMGTPVMGVGPPRWRGDPILTVTSAETSLQKKVTFCGSGGPDPTQQSFVLDGPVGPICPGECRLRPGPGWFSCTFSEGSSGAAGSAGRVAPGGERPVPGERRPPGPQLGEKSSPLKQAQSHYK